MGTTMLHVVTCIVLLTVAWGLPFASQEEANEFLGLKRLPYPANWHPDTMSEQMSEYWATLKKSAQYYMDRIFYLY